MAEVTHEDLTHLVTRAELAAFLSGFGDKMQLAVIEGLKSSIPDIMHTIEDKYGTRVTAMHDALFNKEDGIVITVDRMKPQVLEIPALVKLRWQMFGLAVASNILAVFVGWWIASSVASPVQQYRPAPPVAAEATRIR